MKLAILDRDGTLIDVHRDEETGILQTAFHPDHLKLLGGVLEGLRALAGAGYTLAMATNQPGPAKGDFSADAVRRTNDALVARLAAEGIAIARVEVCMHHPSVGPCDCRKPRPGMLTTLMTALGAAPEETWMIGDARADVEAGHAARVRTALIFRDDRCELCPLRGGPPAGPDVHGKTLIEVAARIIAC